VSKVILSAFVVLMIAGLVLMDVDSLFSGRGPASGPGMVLARVGGEPITAADLARAMGPALAQTGLTQQQAHAFGLSQTMLNNMVADRLAQRAARRVGITVPDAVVARVVAEQIRTAAPGMSEKAALEALLRHMGLTEAAFTDALRADIGVRLLGAALIAPQVNTPPEALVRGLYAHAHEARDIDLVPFRTAGAAEPGPPPEGALEALYAARKGTTFAVPERRALLLAEVNAPEEGGVEALVARADALDDAIVAGRALPDAAKDVPLALREIAPVDERGEGPGAEALDAALGPGAADILFTAFALTPGEASAVLELQDDKGTPRFVAVSVEEVIPRGSQPFAEVQDVLEAQWAEDARRATAEAEAQKALAALRAGEVTLEGVYRTRGNGAGAVKAIRGLERSSPALPLPLVPEAVPAVFAAPVGGYVLLDLPQGPAVAHVLDARLPTQEDIQGADLAPVRARLAEEMAAETLAMAIEAERARTSVQTYPGRLDALYAPEGR